jgi:hypothetical protein
VPRARPGPQGGPQAQRLEGRALQAGQGDKGLKDQLADLAADVLGGTTEPKIGAVVNQILNTRTRLLETERKIRETEELERRLEELEEYFEQQRAGQGGSGSW